MSFQSFKLTMERAYMSTTDPKKILFLYFPLKNK